MEGTGLTRAVLVCSGCVPEGMAPAGASAAKREMRVVARGRSSHHATIRSTLIAAAMATCCPWGMAMPYQGLSSDSRTAHAAPGVAS
jgi:hypothetical protein